MSNSYEQEQIRQVAERIARRLAGGADTQSSLDRNGNGAASGVEINGEINDGEISEIRAGLANINRRLTQIERNISPDSVTTNQSAQTSSVAAPSVSNAKPDAQRNFTSSRHAMLNSMYVPATSSSSVAHPSQERFGVTEAISELVDYFENEKQCGLEPGKPCDQCAMCSSRGF